MSEATPHSKEWIPPAIKPERIERTVHESGRVDVRIHMPTLAVAQVIQEFQKHKEQADGQRGL